MHEAKTAEENIESLRHLIFSLAYLHGHLLALDYDDIAKPGENTFLVHELLRSWCYPVSISVVLKVMRNDG